MNNFPNGGCFFLKNFLISTFKAPNNHIFNYFCTKYSNHHQYEKAIPTLRLGLEHFIRLGPKWSY